MSRASKLYIFVLFFVSAYSFTIRQTVEAGDTVLNLLEGNVTDSQFDDDGTDFDIFSYLFAASSKDQQLEENIPGDITVLAPDDNAFRQAVGDLGLRTSSELETYENFLLYLMNAYRYPIEFLTRILYYHIVPGELNSTVALQLPSLATWDEPSRITREGNTLIDRNPELPNPNFDTERMDIQASNGIIHVIDYVLFPEVMRKLDLTNMESECSSPEASLEDSEPHSDIGPLPTADFSDPAKMDEPMTETAEPNEEAESIPTVTASPFDLDSTFSPSAEQPEPINMVTPPSIDDSLLQDAAPSQESGDLDNNEEDADGPSPNFSQQEQPDNEAQETEPPLLEELPESTASSSPESVSLPTLNTPEEFPLDEETLEPEQVSLPTQEDEEEPEVSPPDFSQATNSDGSSNLSTSPEVVADDINLQFSPSFALMTPKEPGITAVDVATSHGPSPFPSVESASASAEASPPSDASLLPSPTCGSLSHPTAT